jgi:replication factor A1
MNISELKSNTGKAEITAEVIEKQQPKEFEKFGKKGKLCNVIIKDSSGTVKLTLWNEQVELVSMGDMVKISNGWVSEWQGEKQLSTGKFGKLEIVKKDATMVTNDPKLLGEEPEQAEEEFIDDQLE